MLITGKPSLTKKRRAQRSNIMLFKYTLVLLVCILLIDPSDAWGRRLKKKLKKIIKKVAEPVKKIGCKVDMSVNIVPFSDDISDYDVNGDKRVNYEEFVFAVTRTVNLADPTELRRPFTFADVNDVEQSNATNTISYV
ncbi:hypothetical protein MAR_014082 [Mya arenaria]|uniref:EF-hand domain-containing protein n=1 Tax=Mya arenaria TaxID=6604 RepID=A0ABY7G1Q8_MYAAR|nr:hypothetical protein MAR_014082 [Mya arenaria]